MCAKRVRLALPATIHSFSDYPAAITTRASFKCLTEPVKVASHIQKKAM
jgi:hypothetical protein